MAVDLSIVYDSDLWQRVEQAAWPKSSLDLDPPSIIWRSARYLYVVFGEQAELAVSNKLKEVTNNPLELGKYLFILESLADVTVQDRLEPNTIRMVEQLALNANLPAFIRLAAANTCARNFRRASRREQENRRQVLRGIKESFQSSADCQVPGSPLAEFVTSYPSTIQHLDRNILVPCHVPGCVITVDSSILDEAMSSGVLSIYEYEVDHYGYLKLCFSASLNEHHLRRRGISDLICGHRQMETRATCWSPSQPRVDFVLKWHVQRKQKAEVSLLEIRS